MKITLDAGHGKDTPGKRSPDGSLREFQFNSVVAELLNSRFKQYENVGIQFTHNYTSDVPLSDRTRLANTWGSDLFISIHANAYGSGWNSANGIETYVHTSNPPQAVKVANQIQNQLIDKTGRTDRGVKTANFQVLRETKMTAVLVECGFMSNKGECELLKSDHYRNQVADAIEDAVVSVYNLKLKKAAVPSPQKKPETLYKVQVGAFGDLKNAEDLKKQLERDGYKVYISQEQ
jgi:N-acetylmuramoyl-L-alanine amidase